MSAFDNLVDALLAQRDPDGALFLRNHQEAEELADAIVSATAEAVGPAPKPEEVWAITPPHPDDEKHAAATPEGPVTVKYTTPDGEHEETHEQPAGVFITNEQAAEMEQIRKDFAQALGDNADLSVRLADAHQSDLPSVEQVLSAVQATAREYLAPEAADSLEFHIRQRPRFFKTRLREILEAT